MKINENNDKYKKGSVLMKSALEKYEKGDYEGGDKDREMANKFFDEETEPDVAFDETDDLALYGENRNFGVIYNVFEANAKNFVSENKNLAAIKEIAKTIKSNKVLKEQFDCYDALKNRKIKGDASDYVNEAISMLPSLDKKEVRKSNAELISLMRKHKLDERINISEEDMELFESIEYVLLNGKNLKNINDYNESIEVIKENLEKRSNEKTEEFTCNEDFDKYVQEVLNRQALELSEDEEKLLKELNEGKGEEMFNEYKNETLKFVCEQIDKAESVEDKVEWNNILTKISIKQYDKNKMLEDIASFINVQNIINE